MQSILNEIKRETAEMIDAQARALGLSVDDYLRTLLPPANETVLKLDVRSSAFRRKFVVYAEIEDTNFRLKAELRTFHTVSNGHGVERPFHETATPQQWTTVFREWAASHTTLPSIADDSRETIYEDRGE